MRILDIPLLEKELVELNMNNDTLKIDHPVTGSKDISDSLACATQNCINHRTVDDFISDEYSEDDLAHAFRENSIQQYNYNTVDSIVKTDTKRNTVSTISDIKQNTISDEDSVDMEYFRF